MNVTLRFNLPEDQDEYENCINAGRLAAAVADFADYLRREWKYGERELYDIEEIRDKFYECMRDRSVNTDVL